MAKIPKSEFDRGIATLTLDRPDKLNAFTDDMLEQWLEALGECGTNPEVRIVVTGTLGLQARVESGMMMPCWF